MNDAMDVDSGVLFVEEGGVRSGNGFLSVSFAKFDEFSEKRADGESCFEWVYWFRS